MRDLCRALALALLLTSCSDDKEPAPEDPGDEEAPYLGGPLCTDIVDVDTPNEVFGTALLAAEAIQDAYPFGSTEPDNVQEVINFELGFYIKNEPMYASVPLTAPADLYIEALSVTYHDDDDDGVSDHTDYGINYEVCSAYIDGERQPAVVGNFAHVKTLAPDLQTLMDEAALALESGDVLPDDSPLRCDEGGVDGPGSCTWFASLVREDDPEYALVVEEGSPLGATGYPGIDANLQDRRSENPYVNADRWTAASGHAQGYKWGACTYEYFVEPYRTQYLNKVGANGVFRNLDDEGQPIVVEHPCGLLTADEPGTAAGYWILATAADLQIDDDASVPETELVLSKLLVLTEHYLLPNSHLAISTNLIELSEVGDSGQRSMVELERGMPPGTQTNIAFDEVVPGEIYCYEGNSYLGFEPYYFLLALENEPSPELTIERVDAPCDALPQQLREFSGAALEFVR